MSRLFLTSASSGSQEGSSRAIEPPFSALIPKTKHGRVDAASDRYNDEELVHLAEVPNFLRG